MQGQLEQVAQVCTQSSFDYLHSLETAQHLRATNLSVGRNAQGSAQPQLLIIQST